MDQIQKAPSPAAPTTRPDGAIGRALHLAISPSQVSHMPINAYGARLARMRHALVRDGRLAGPGGANPTLRVLELASFC